MRVAIGVLASAPLPGRCKPELLSAHGAEWVAGLYAAMLRDTLDGLNAIEAERYVVFARNDDVPALEPHVHAPWSIDVAEAGDPGARYVNAFEDLLTSATIAIVASADAPSFPVDPVANALTRMGDSDAPQGILAPTEGGTTYLLALNRPSPTVLRDAAWNTPALVETIRIRARDASLPLIELPPWYAVEAPSDVLRLIDELRAFPERAPRTAQFLVTHA